MAAFLLLPAATTLAVEPAVQAKLAVTNGLELWFDAGNQNTLRNFHTGMPPLAPGNFVDRLLDGSGHARHLTQLQRNSRPKFRHELERSFLLFDGADDALTIANLNTNFSSVTVFIVTAPHANPGMFSGLFSLNRSGQNDYTSGMNCDLGPAPSTQLSFLNIEGAGFGGATQFLKTAPAAFGGWHILSIRSEAGPGGVALYLDGTPQGTRDRSPSRIGMDEFTLGCRLYSNAGDPPFAQGFYHGEIAEFLLYSRALNGTERTAVEQYLKVKYAALLARPPRLDTLGKPLVTVTNPPPVQFLVPGFAARELPVSLKNINNIKYRPDGTLVALGYDGRIFLLSDADHDGVEEQVRPFWSGDSLRSPIGMALTPLGSERGQGVFVAAKGRVSLIVDTNADDHADQEIIVAEGWKQIIHNVDALGVAVASDGSVYFGVGTADFTNPYQIDSSTGNGRYDLRGERGTIIKVSPDFRHREIVCTGIRFPVALAFNSAGDLFCTDQEGATWLPNGNPFDELLHIQPGRHYGFPPRHPKYLPGVIDEPSVFDYAPQHQSTCGLNFNEPSPGGASFGPASWEHDAFVCGYSRGKIWRTQLAKTESGYVAQTRLIASVPALAVDACVSPGGALVLSTHSGEPDWGSGPNGAGHLYKIVYARKDVPQPVAAWSASPSELRIAFDRPLAASMLKDLKSRIDITQGEFVSPGDRFETKRPGYAVVYSQLSAPRFDVPVESLSFTPDARNLILHTRSLNAAQNYAVTLRNFVPPLESRTGALPQIPDLDLVADLHGLRAEWTPAVQDPSHEPWEGWLPHPDLQVSAQFTRGSADHALLWSGLENPGRLAFHGQLDLWQMLQPAIQPGGKLDYERSREEVTVLLTSSAPFTIQLGNSTLSSEKNAEGKQQIFFKRTSEQSWLPFDVALQTGPGFVPLTFSASWFTDADPRPRAFPLRRFFLPWALEERDSSTPAPPANPPQLAGGNWLQGKRIFFSETAMCSKCHAIRGEGQSVGPDLSNLVHRDYESVLKDIRFPNAALNPDHLAYLVQLTDGEELTAVLQQDARDAVTVADAGGRRTIPKSRIKSITATGLSLMPEGLAQALGADPLRDLLTFLLTSPLEPAPIEIAGLPPSRAAREIEGALKFRGAVPAEPSPPLRILLCDGPKDHGLNEHDYPLWQSRWARLLTLAPNVTVGLTHSFPSPGQFENADVVVFYSDNPGWSAAKEEDLQKFQARGGGLVYLHFAVDGHEASDALSRQIGLAWRGGTSKFRHGPLDLTFDSSNPLSTGFSRLHLVDESYWDLVGDDRSIHVLASGIEDGRARPLMWTRENGPGRVFVSIPGHYTWTFDDPLFRILILRGICWAAHQPPDRLADLATIAARIAVSPETDGVVAEAKNQ